MKDIGRGILGILLGIFSFIILATGVISLLFGTNTINTIVGIILIIIGGGIFIASRKRIWGH